MSVHGKDLHLRVRVRVTDAHAHQEPVELGLREGVRAFVLDRVLRRDDHERTLERIRVSVERDLTFLHRLEEGRLRLRRCTVDLVTEDDLREDRAGTELDPALPSPDPDARDVGREQVGRELDPPERAAERPGECLREHRLPDARDVLDQDVALSEKRDDAQTDGVVLALDHVLDGLRDPVERRRERVECFRWASRHES